MAHRIWKHQENRRNLTAYHRAEIALKLKDVVAAKAKERQKGGQGGVLLPANLPEAKETRKELAEIAGVGSRTLAKAEFIAEHADEETKDKLRQGVKGTSIDKEYNRLRAEEKASAATESIPEPDDTASLSTDEHYPPLSQPIPEKDSQFQAAKKLGLEKVPVHVAVDLTPEQVRAYRIADNKTGEIADWDMQILPIELSELKATGFDMGLLAFSEKELTQLLNISAAVAQGLTDPDSVPEPPDDPITQKGDLWILGNHRLLCGDSAKPEDVDRLLDGNIVHLVCCDPPYNVKVESRSNNAIAAGLSSYTNTHHQGFDVARDPGKAAPTTKKMRPKDRPLANDFVSDEEFDRLLDAWFGNMARGLEPGRSFYIGPANHYRRTGYGNRRGGQPAFDRGHDQSDLLYCVFAGGIYPWRLTL